MNRSCSHETESNFCRAKFWEKERQSWLLQGAEPRLPFPATLSNEHEGLISERKGRQGLKKKEVDQTTHTPSPDEHHPERLS